MTLEEVERDIPLGEWRAQIQDMEVQLQVSSVSPVPLSIPFPPPTSGIHHHQIELKADISVSLALRIWSAGTNPRPGIHILGKGWPRNMLHCWGPSL